MISEGKIGPTEARSTVTTILVINALFSSSFAANYGLSAAWLTVLFSGLVAAVALYFPSSLMRRFPDQTIFDVCRSILGSIGGFVAGSVLCSMFLLYSGLYLRSSTDRIITVYLPGTHKIILFLFFLVLAGICAYLGLEALTRVIKLLSILLILSLIVPILLTYEYWDLNHLYPLLGDPKGILRGGIIMSGMFWEIILLAVFFPSIKGNTSLGIWYRPFIVSLGINALIAFLMIVAFSYPSISEETFPVVQSTRLIYLGRFLQRTDALFAFFWMLAILLKFSLFFYITNTSLARLFKLPYYRPLIIPIAIVISCLAYLPHDIVQLMRLGSIWAWPICGGIAFGLPAVLLLIHSIKSRFIKNAKPALEGECNGNNG